MVVSYEEAVASRVVLEQVLRHFSIPGIDESVISQKSSMSRKDSPATADGYASAYWLRNLDNTQINAAMAVLNLFGFDEIFHADGSVETKNLAEFAL